MSGTAPKETPLYGIVETYYPQFLARLEADSGSLPAFVKQAFDDYLKCGQQRATATFTHTACNPTRHPTQAIPIGRTPQTTPFGPLFFLCSDFCHL
ncbi:MAG: hypothetical protein OXP09_01900 [Gammaproteobacteria bacterium]|nr:hypothetical protein [Gammaproteobacteria bacterium]MDE0364308.1 hypothetical protein [Gammaproteobacteria bacterium]